jgi:hypothetical protein
VAALGGKVGILVAGRPEACAVKRGARVTPDAKLIFLTVMARRALVLGRRQG